MKLNVNEKSEIELREVYGGIILISDDNEKFGICMRDSGFEFSYQGEWYEAKEGIIRKMSIKNK